MKKVIIMLIMISLSSSCQSTKNSNSEPNKEQKNKKTINILDVNFEEDLKTIQKQVQFKRENPDFSEYLNSYASKEITKFSLGKLSFNDKFKIDNLEVPNESLIYFVTKQEDDKQICVIGFESNSLKNKTENLQSYVDIFGKPNKLNDQNSINKMKNIDNFIWKNFSNKYTYILSQSSEGNIMLKDGNSKKITKSILYIIDNKASINYPNQQKENILERLTKKLSY